MKESLNTIVNLEAQNGICCFSPSFKALMHSFNASRLLLI